MLDVINASPSFTVFVFVKLNLFLTLKVRIFPIQPRLRQCPSPSCVRLMIFSGLVSLEKDNETFSTRIDNTCIINYEFSKVFYPFRIQVAKNHQLHSSLELEWQ